MTEETKDGPTPSGGVRSTIYYEDAQGNPVDKAAATNVMIVEFDKDGNSIRRTYGTLGNRTDDA